VELDYVRWEPTILGPGTAEGIWAHVVGKHGCDYRPQDLGPAYSGGHQFWVQPSALKAWVDIAIEIPRAGSCEIVVKYTKSWDYACVQAFLDGELLGPVADTYAPTVVSADPLTLGKLDLPEGTMEPVGYIIMQHAVRAGRPAKAYERWTAKVPAEYRISVLGKNDSTRVPAWADDGYCLSLIKHYRSLMPMAMEAHKPMFFLKPADGAIGAHTAAVAACYEDFKQLANRIAENCGIALSV